MATAYDALTPKQQAFVDAYFVCGFNATEAARQAKYKQPQVQGSRLLENVEVYSAVRERLAEYKISAGEVLARLTDHARGTLEDFATVDAKGIARLNLAQAKRRGRFHLIHKLTERTWFDKSKKAEVREVEVQLYNAQSALLSLAKVYSLIGDPVGDELSRKLKEEQLKIAQYEREEWERRAKGGPQQQRMEGRPRPQGGPGVGSCGLYHQALDIDLYPTGPLAQPGAVDQNKPCPICGGEPFHFEGA